jgi:hypothetical protein
MWPFRKKQPKAVASVPFQEFLRTYVPPAPRAIENPLPVETVCPVCFTQFPVGTMPADWPICPDCSSEGMDIGVEPLEVFLASKTLEDLDEIAYRWEAAEGFLPQYKSLKASNIAHLRARKAAAER